MLNRFKSLALAILLAGTSFAVVGQTPFRIKGDLKDSSMNGEKVFVSYFNGMKKVYTSTVVEGSRFAFEGTIKDPAKAVLTLNTTKEMRALNPWVYSVKRELFMEGGEITMQGLPFESSVVKAPGRSQLDFQMLQAKLKEVQQTADNSQTALYNALAARDNLAASKLRIINERAKAQIDSIEFAFLKAHPASHVSLDLLRERISAKSLAEKKEEMAALFNNLSAALKKTIVGQQLSDRIQASFRLSPGKPAAEFVLNDTLGNPIYLTSLKGQYVLLDFWASWCVPCRYENATVVKAYERFKDKNFTVLSVSLEKPGDRQAWVDAIKKDGLTWTQVATLTSEENTRVSKLYGIQSIPMNYLIDPKGTIIAVHLRGEALLKKLEEVL